MPAAQRICLGSGRSALSSSGDLLTGVIDHRPIGRSRKALDKERKEFLRWK